MGIGLARLVCLGGLAALGRPTASRWGIWSIGPLGCWVPANAACRCYEAWTALVVGSAAFALGVVLALGLPRSGAVGKS